jgi:hypothetical protein
VRASAIALLSVVLAPAASLADFIEADTLREVRLSFAEETLTGLGFFDETLTFSGGSCSEAMSASQTSTVGPRAILFDGSSSASASGCGFAEATSILQTAFELAPGEAVAVEGTLRRSVLFDVAFSGFAILEIRTDEGPVVSLAGNSLGLIVSEVFDLPAGVYTLLIQTAGSAFGHLDEDDFPVGGTGSGEASLQISITPEPTTMLLLAIGLAALARRRAPP